MATYGYTVPDKLPYPSVTSESANVPVSTKALADAVQLTLNGKVATTRKIVAGNGLKVTPTAGDLSSDVTIDLVVGTGLTVTADSVNVNYTTLDTVYPRKTHTHNPTQVGVDVLRFGPYALNAGKEFISSGHAKVAGSIVFITIQHGSAYIFGVISAITSTTYAFKIRNSTESTDHTGIYVHIAEIKDA